MAEGSLRRTDGSETDLGGEMNGTLSENAARTMASAVSRRYLARVRVLLVDDDPTELERLSVALSDEVLAVVGTTDSGEHALDLARILDPDVAVIRWSLCHFGGGLTARLMRWHAPSVIPLLLLEVKDIEEVRDLTRGMGFASVMRHVGDAELRRTLRAIGGSRVALEAPLEQPVRRRDVLLRLGDGSGEPRVLAARPAGGNR